MTFEEFQTSLKTNTGFVGFRASMDETTHRNEDVRHIIGTGNAYNFQDLSGRVSSPK